MKTLIYQMTLLPAPSDWLAARKVIHRTLEGRRARKYTKRDETGSGRGGVFMGEGYRRETVPEPMKRRRHNQLWLLLLLALVVITVAAGRAAVLSCADPLVVPANGRSAFAGVCAVGDSSGACCDSHGAGDRFPLHSDRLSRQLGCVCLLSVLPAPPSAAIEATGKDFRLDTVAALPNVPFFPLPERGERDRPALAPGSPASPQCPPAPSRAPPTHPQA
jgi:hypothetical protein